MPIFWETKGFLCALYTEILNLISVLLPLIVSKPVWVLVAIGSGFWRLSKKDSNLHLSFTCNLVTEDRTGEIDSAYVVRMVATHYLYKDYHKESESTELAPIGPWHSSDSGGLVPNDEMLIGSDMFVSFIFWCVDEYLMYL